MTPTEDPDEPRAGAETLPGDGLAGTPSRALLGDDVRRRYLSYFKSVFRDGAVDERTKEMVAFGVALALGATNPVEGHLRKLVQMGVTRAEVEEVVAVTLGVAAASVVDRADIGYAALTERVGRVFDEAAGGGS